MLFLHLDNVELFNNDTNEFVTLEAKDVCLEHSLDAISKWEAFFKKPFLSEDPKAMTMEEDRYYIKCMSSDTMDDNDIKFLSSENRKKIDDYLEDKHTATWFSDNKDKGSSKKEIVTSEIIYYWMIEAGIPFECDKWNINRLLTLIRVCGIKMRGDKKMSKKDIMAQNRLLNAQRRAKTNSRG